MTGISWRAVDLLCQMLEPDERAAVRGDLAESGESGARALVGVLGLVLRRQAALWKAWQPWAVLAGIVLPFGLSLGLQSWGLSHNGANYFLAYASQWNNPIIREGFPGFAANTLILWLPVSCICWISSFVLGFVSRRTIPINGALYGSAMALGYVAYPHLLGGSHRWLPPASGFAAYQAVSLTVLAVVVVFPSVWGIRQGIRLPTQRPIMQTILRSATIGTLAVLCAIQLVNWWRFTGGFTHPPIPDGSTHRLSSVARFSACWPLAYLVVITVKRRRQLRGAAEVAGT